MSGSLAVLHAMHDQIHPVKPFAGQACGDTGFLTSLIQGLAMPGGQVKLCYEFSVLALLSPLVCAETARE